MNNENIHGWEERQAWEEEFERLMPKNTNETMDYEQFCAVRQYLRSVFTQKEEEKRKLYDEMVEGVEKQHLISCTVGKPYLIKQDDTLTTLKTVAEKHSITE